MDRNIALIMREDMRTVKVVYGIQPPTTFNAGKTPYTYATNMKLEMGDLVLVKAADQMKVATVIGVDDNLEIGPNSEIEYDLIVQKIDLDPYLAEKRKLKELEEVLHEEYRRRARLSAREALLMSLDDSGRSKVLALLGGAK